MSVDEQPPVIPANAGIHRSDETTAAWHLDPRLRGDDGCGAPGGTWIAFAGITAIAGTARNIFHKVH